MPHELGRVWRKDLALREQLDELVHVGAHVLRLRLHLVLNASKSAASAEAGVRTPRPLIGLWAA